MDYRISSQFVQLWNEAFQYQDFRTDKGHAFVVTLYAQDICKREKTNPEVVVPAAILHDIGWSQLPHEERMSVFKRGVERKERMRIRLAHQEESVRLANELLGSTEYPQKHWDEILEIVSEHDTREGFLHANEGSMKDADKLWMFDDYGFLNDNMISGIPFDVHVESLEKKLEKDELFYFESSRKLAVENLEKIRKKYLPL